MRRGWWIFPLALLLGCAPAASNLRGSSKPGEAAPETFLAPPKGVDTYTTVPASSAVRGGPEAQRLDRTLIEVARARGIELSGDGRLADLATFVALSIDPTGKPPASAAIDAYAHRLGLIEPVPLYMIFGQDKEDAWAPTLQEMLRGAPRNTAYNRYGIVILPRFGQRIAAIVMSAACADIEPIARRVREGGALSLHGRLRSRYQHPQVEITLPDGSVKHVADQTGTDFDFTVPIGARGVHRIEILADGPFGIEVLANFPVFAGVDEPPIPRVYDAEGTSVGELGDSSLVAARLLGLLNNARKLAGVPPLEEKPELAEVAEAHSRDMVDSGFFGHLSPQNGDPAARVRKRGLGFVLIAENVGRGSTAEEVNTMLLDSPGHRANALNSDLTHVGIGVAIDKRGGHPHIVATEEFGGVAKTIDPRTAPDELVKLINARRSTSGFPQLEVDPLLTQAAQKGATVFFDEPALSQQEVVEGVNNRLARPAGGRGSSIGRRMRTAQSFLIPVIAVAHATNIEQAFDPAARYIGVGITQGNRPETGPNTIAVLLVLGWPR
jgi:uncharacterized protein YkwD